MTDLADEHCEACRLDAPKLSSEALTQLLPEIPDWNVIEDNGVKQLQKIIKTRNFVDAMTLANKIGDLAEAHQHHPAILVEWGQLTIRWWSHKIKGLHKNDVILAAKTDKTISEQTQ